MIETRRLWTSRLERDEKVRHRETVLVAIIVGATLGKVPFRAAFFVAPRGSLQVSK